MYCTYAMWPMMMMMMSSCRGDSWIDRTSKSVLTFQLISFRVRLLRFSLGDSPEPTPRPVPGLDEMREGKCGKSNSSSNGLFIHILGEEKAAAAKDNQMNFNNFIDDTRSQ